MPTIPAVMFLEIAMDALKIQDPDIIARETKEFDFLGTSRKAEIMALLPGKDEMTVGYLLGIETARALLATMPAAVIAKVSI